jgi:hypothetical protein
MISKETEAIYSLRVNNKGCEVKCSKGIIVDVKIEQHDSYRRWATHLGQMTPWSEIL